MNKNKKNRKGFTIVELVIVIAVIGILATVLVPTFGTVIADAQEKAALQEGKNLYTKYISNLEYEDGATPVSTVYFVDGDIYVEIADGSAKVVNALPTDECYEQIGTDAKLTHKGITDCTHTAAGDEE